MALVVYRESSAFGRSKALSVGGKLQYYRVRGNWKIPKFFSDNLQTTGVKKICDFFSKAEIG